MSQGTEIKVCILSYNRPDYLREALLSVLRQTLSPDAVEIYDNGSDEAVFESVRDCVEDGRAAWSGSERNNGDNGVHWNLNRVFCEENARWPFLYAMHDDDRICPTFLEKQVGFLERNPSVVAVACNASEIDAEGNYLNTFLHNPKRRKDVEYYGDVADVVRLYMRSFLAFPSIVYRSSVATRVPFRIHFGQLLDVGFLMDLVRKGPIAYVNQPLREYRQHKGQSHTSSRNDWRNLEDYQVSLVKEYPQLFPPINAYVAKRRAYRCMKRLGGFLRSMEPGKSP